MDTPESILREIGEIVEATGRMLKRKPPLTHEDLTQLRNTLSFSSETVQTVRDTLTERNL